MERPIGGFNFEFTERNAVLAQHVSSDKLPKTKKTGTTIAGIIFKDGVVLGADTRATEGPIVADKNCEKIHYLAPNIFCCGAGTSADCEHTTELMASNLALHRLNTGREGHISTALVIGGVDSTGPHLYTIHPHGSVDKLPYVTMGSGSLAAMTMFEAQYSENMPEPAASELVQTAIKSGMFNDLGSGGNCDITIIRRGSVERFRNIFKTEDIQPKYHSKTGFKFKRGNTAFYAEKVQQLRGLVDVVEGDAMETS